MAGLKTLIGGVTVGCFMCGSVFAGANPVGVFEPGFLPPPFGDGAGAANAANPYATALSMKKVSKAATEHVARSIQTANALCAAGAREYEVSCLADQLEQIAKSMPKDGDYAQSAKILADTAQKLRTVAQQNRDVARPRVRLKGQTPVGAVTTGRLIAVRTAALPTVEAQAGAILREAQTLLLRSVANSDRRKIHYATIAQAVGSNKVLLRSL